MATSVYVIWMFLCVICSHMTSACVFSVHVPSLGVRYPFVYDLWVRVIRPFVTSWSVLSVHDFCVCGSYPSVYDLIGVLSVCV